MAKDPDIFNLVKSLSQTEKRYFRIFASQQIKAEKNVYVKMYEYLEKLKDYNEEKIRKKFQWIGSTNKIAVIKNYLYNLILKSLRNYYSESSTDSVLNNYLLEAEILFERGMIEQCEKIINKAVVLASECEKFSLLIELYNRKERILYLQYTPELHDKQIYELQKRKQTIGNKLTYLGRLTTLGNELFSLYKTKQIKNEVSLAKLVSLESAYHELIKKGETDESIQSFFSKNHINYIQFLIFWLKGDTENAFVAQKQHLQFIESNFTVFEDRIGNYISSLNNYMDVSLRLKRHEVFSETLTKLKKLYLRLAKKLTEPQKARIFKTITFAEFNVYMSTGNFSDAALFSKKVIEDLPFFENLLGEDVRLKMYSSLAYVYFGNGQYKESLFWLNKIINETDLTVRADLQTFSRMLRLFIFHENNNFELLEYALKSFEKHIKKRQTNLQYESLTIDMLKQLMKANESSERKNIFNRLRILFFELKNKKTESMAFAYFDVLAWIDGKLQQKTFAQIIKEQLAIYTICIYKLVQILTV